MSITLTPGTVRVGVPGLAPALPNDATKYLDGSGAYSVPAGGGTATAGLIVQEVDGSPSGTATVLVLPNTTLAISGGTATYTPTGGGASSPLAGAGGTGDATGGRVVFADASGSAGGSASVGAGHADGHSDRGGGAVELDAGTTGGVFGTAWVLSGGSVGNRGAHSQLEANGEFDLVHIISNNPLQLSSNGTHGTGGQFLGSNNGSGAVWTTPTVRIAAGVPSGAPGTGELPIALDTTSSTGGVYGWNGSSWVKAGP